MLLDLYILAHESFHFVVRANHPFINSNRTTYTPVYLHLEHPSGVP